MIQAEKPVETEEAGMVAAATASANLKASPKRGRPAGRSLILTYLLLIFQSIKTLLAQTFWNNMNRD